jgi:ligand-binding SRPBCC domain-containing protein
MHTYSSSVIINATPEEVFDFHTNHQNLSLITPPSIKVRTVQSEPTSKGARMIMNVTQFGLITMQWIVRFTEYQRPNMLCDEMEKGPFKVWRQTRRIEAHPQGAILHDTTDYQLPLGVLGAIANSLFVKYQVQSMFAYRQKRTKELIESASINNVLTKSA